ncbi:MAG: hypothetical protein F6K42_15440 [Leptolyngbya sp. SIO1D8]|nr:hypothetical protein [Leptolyngbya sp. SIO1D8]
MANLAASHYWLDVAEDKAESMHNPKLYIGIGLGGGLVLGSLLNPFTALIALAWAIFCAWNANESNSDQIEAVEDGIIAHLLDKKQLRQYATEVGMAQVELELATASSRQLSLTEAAETLGKRLKLDQVEKRPDADFPMQEEQAGGIGVNTRLNALPVPAESLPPESFSDLNSGKPTENENQTIADDLGAHIQNSLIVGKPGSGKGILLSNALRVAKATHPKLKIYVIDPKGDPLEQPYWQGCDCVASKACQDLMPLEVWEWIQSCIREFQLIQGAKLLVIDELRYLSNTFARCNDKQTKALDNFWYIVESFTSLGDAQRSHVWGVSQSSHTADLKISGGTLGQFRVVALVNTVDFGFYDTLVSTNIVQRHPDPTHLREVIAGRSPVHRVYYDSKSRKWDALPELTNYSSRDRDKGIEDGSSIYANTNTLEVPLNQVAGITLEERIISYLEGKEEFVPAHQIKSAFRELKNMTAKEARDFLHRMADEEMITRKIKGFSVLFGVIVIPPQDSSGQNSQLS